nr:hypothetical protein [Pseudomonas putida]
MFVVGASAFPNNGGYNPTITVGALAIRAARAIHETYFKNPGTLVKGRPNNDKLEINRQRRRTCGSHLWSRRRLDGMENLRHVTL